MVITKLECVKCMHFSKMVFRSGKCDGHCKENCGVVEKAAALNDRTVIFGRNKKSGGNQKYGKGSCM